MSARNGSTPKFGTPTGRFLELSQKINKPEPYTLTDRLVVQPMTRGRRLKLADAESRLVVAQAQLNMAYALSRLPAPPVPPLPAVPEIETTDDGDEEAAKAAQARHDTARAAVEERYTREMAQWKQEVAQWRDNLESAQESISRHSATAQQAETDYHRAFFGDIYDQLIEFFDDQPEGLWDEFVADYQKSQVPSQPDDGTCAACGRVDDEETVGKDTKSLTG